MSDPTVSINIVQDSKVIAVPYTKTTTAEDAVIHVCKSLNIGNLARHLFALRITGKQTYLMPGAKFHGEKYNCFDLRIRFKVPNFNTLRKVDAKAYDYYFHQARNDVLENRVPDISYEKYKRELVGLGITDMYRVMLEKEIPRESVEGEYKKYIPKEVIKRHYFFIKKPIHDTLGKLAKSDHDPSYVKAEYLKQLDVISPEYLSETFKATAEFGTTSTSIVIKLIPHLESSDQPNRCATIKYSTDSKKDITMCAIDDIGFISLGNKNGTVQIFQKSGIPFYLMFTSKHQMFSFLSLLDGYYRLTCKWTFNICKDVLTPSLLKLYGMKCHGPVGGEFSYAKLEEKRGNRPGCFIIRESESKYNHYFIDVCMKDNLKPKTFKLERITGDEFIFNDDLTRYKSIYQLIAAYSNANGAIYLQECLPPSEYDKSQLLLCQSEILFGASLTDSTALNDVVPRTPQCINAKELQVFKSKKQEGSKTQIYKGMWKITKSKKIEVAIKFLKTESSENHLTYFLDLAGIWAFLKSSSIVRMYGITLSKNMSMVLEYFPLGALDIYLKTHKSIIKTVDLIEAASNLASALWHLEENRIVHGNIRCRKLMVEIHDENAFRVKLSDPGIHTSYSSKEPKEVHWIPVECYSNLDFAKRSTAADVWAFSTTLWEIFMFGEEISSVNHVEAMRLYASGKILPKPPQCPENIYQLMKECWEIDPHRRKQPQAIMRDINQIFYEEYNSRRTLHSYSKIFSKGPHSSAASTVSTTSLNSNVTDSTCVANCEDLMALSDVDSIASSHSGFSSGGWAFTPSDLVTYSDSMSSDFSNILPNFNFMTATTSLDSINSMQNIFELDNDCSVVLQGRIGQGFYGDVFKGTLENWNDDKATPRQVAVKKLKATAMGSCLQDFEREINIMKALSHPNIVEILGVLRDPEILLIMEFVQHGSLQSYLKINRESLDTKQLLKYALDIAKGMEYLGTKCIVHRDLAARNILVVDETHVKISDFGLAQVMGNNDYYILKTNRELPIKWYALESLKDGKFSTRSDVWSFGVTMCEMFNHGEEPRLPHLDDKKTDGQEQATLINALETGARLPCPSICPQSVYIRIIYPCWQSDPHERPTFHTIITETEDLLTQY